MKINTYAHTRFTQRPTSKETQTTIKSVSKTFDVDVAIMNFEFSNGLTFTKKIKCSDLEYSLRWKDLKKDDEVILHIESNKIFSISRILEN